MFGVRVFASPRRRCRRKRDHPDPEDEVNPQLFGEGQRGVSSRELRRAARRLFNGPATLLSAGDTLLNGRNGRNKGVGVRGRRRARTVSSQKTSRMALLRIVGRVSRVVGRVNRRWVLRFPSQGERGSTMAEGGRAAGLLNTTAPSPRRLQPVGRWPHGPRR